MHDRIITPDHNQHLGFPGRGEKAYKPQYNHADIDNHLNTPHDTPAAGGGTEAITVYPTAGKVIFHESYTLLDYGGASNIRGTALSQTASGVLINTDGLYYAVTRAEFDESGSAPTAPDPVRSLQLNGGGSVVDADIRWYTGPSPTTLKACGLFEASAGSLVQSLVYHSSGASRTVDYHRTRIDVWKISD